MCWVLVAGCWLLGQRSQYSHVVGDSSSRERGMQFAALNRETSEGSLRPQGSGKKTTKEAQESSCLQRYNEAIRLQQEGSVDSVDSARAIYQEILGSKVMDEAGASSTMLLRLKFLIFKNLGSIARNHGDHSVALDAFIQAVGVDGSDVTVWYQLSQASCNLGNLLLARKALEEATKCQPQHWPATDLLCTVLLALEDRSACLRVISDSLEHHPHFPRGLAYLHHIATSSPHLLTFHPSLRLQLMKPRPHDTDQLVGEAMQLARRRGLLLGVKVLEECIIPPKPMPYYSLYSLGKGLLSIYRHCLELSRRTPSMATPVDLHRLSAGTSEGPLLPAHTVSTAEVGDTCSSSEEGGEGGGGGGGGRRPEGKRKTPDLLQALLPKRRSSRVKLRREQVNTCERFAQFLPDNLRGCVFGDVCALSPLPSSGHTPPPTDQSESSALDSAPRLSDTEVVKTFLQEHKNNSGIISLSYSYLLLLALHYNWRWAEASYPVARMFMELYELLQPHLLLPSPLCSPSDPEYASLQDMAMICVCYCELKVECLQRAASSEPLPPSLTHTLSFSQLACEPQVRGWMGTSEFTLRVYWCLFKLRTLQMNTSATYNALLKCKELLECSDSQCFVLPNLRQDACISPDVISSKMKSVEQMKASEEVYGLFQSGDHTAVVLRLRPLLEWKSDSYSQFLVGGDHGDEKQTPISLLLSSLLHLERRQECVECCVHALSELLLSYKLGSEKWVAALRDTYSQLNRCLSDGGVDLLRECGERVRRHLMVGVFKTLDLHVEMADSAFLPLMPLTLPWNVLYTTLLCVWGTGDEVAMETSTELNMDAGMDTESPSVTIETDEQSVSLAPMTNQEGLAPSAAMATSNQLELQFLSEAHVYLGSGGQGWCARDGGCFLKTMVLRLREELRVITAHSPQTRETLLRELEQCYYCLYGHPHKKAKAWGLQEHGAEQLPLTWESAQVLLEFYHPSFLPAAEENRALTPELVALYRRIVDIIPDTGKVMPLSTIAGYIEGRVEALPLSSPPSPHTPLVSEIFYLLADDALKSGEFLTALHNYIQSICYCPERVDTWAGLALARARSIMRKLDRRDVRGGPQGMEAVLQKQVTPTLRCFKRALALGSQHRYISEKYGLFCYTIQSHCSQIITQSELVKRELVSWATRTRHGLLQLAQQCFSSALSDVGVARVWPWFYSLVSAKAGMKLGLSPSHTLPILIRAAKQQCTEETTPPVTIELRGQWMTSVELHYQIYSCALKYLLNNCKKEGEREGEKEGGGEGGREGEGEGEREGEKEENLAVVMADCQGLPLGRVGYEGVREWVRAVLRGQSGQYYKVDAPLHYGADIVSRLVQKIIADAEREVAMEIAMEAGTGNYLEQQQSSTCPETTPPETTHPGLLEQCMYGVGVCSVRCPAYYKSIYRLASTFHSLGHSQVSRALLLGPLPQPLLMAQDKLQPLFLLKPNIFANFWQIPVDEINRPGRFSSYVRSSVQLLCEVLSQQLDSSSLVLLVQHLRPRPDSSRQYLRDYERVVMCQKAIQCCTSVHTQLIRETSGSEMLKALLLEIYSLRSLAQRTDCKQHTITKGVEANLVQCYSLYSAQSPPTDTTAGGGVASDVEEAVKYCQSYTARARTDKSHAV